MIARATYAGLRIATAGTRAIAGTRSRLSRRHDPPPAEGPFRVLMVAMYPGQFTGTKYRLRTWAERLERRGFETELVLAMPDRHSMRLVGDWSLRARAEFHLRLLRGRLDAIGRASRFHAAVIHMNDLPYWNHGPPFVGAALRRLAGRVLLDLDDLQRVTETGRLLPKAQALGSLVDGLILGNPLLRDHYPDAPWWYVPTCVEPTEWEVPDRGARSGRPLLGWVGTDGNLRNLEPIAPALAEVCRRHGTRVRIVCSEPAGLPGVPEEFVKWTARGEQSDLEPIDIGLAPLVDGLQQRHKCGLKAIQYMASGAPVVASPVGQLTSIVEHERSGMLASTNDEWTAALDRLLSDRELRLRLGADARRRVEECWSFSAHEPSFEDALRGVRPRDETPAPRDPG